VECPHCGLFNQAGTERCECGHDFVTGIPPSRSVPRRQDAASGCLVAFALSAFAVVASSAPFIYLGQRESVTFVPEALAIAMAAGLVAWWQRELAWFGVVGIYAGVAIGSSIYIAMDSSSSHNLFPFEVIAICIFATLPIGFGAFIGQALRAWRTRTLHARARLNEESKTPRPRTRPSG
jgi:hypothetical protein